LSKSEGQDIGCACSIRERERERERERDLIQLNNIWMLDQLHCGYFSLDLWKYIKKTS